MSMLLQLPEDALWKICMTGGTSMLKAFSQICAIRHQGIIQDGITAYRNKLKKHISCVGMADCLKIYAMCGAHTSTEGTCGLCMPSHYWRQPVKTKQCYYCDIQWDEVIKVDSWRKSSSAVPFPQVSFISLTFRKFHFHRFVPFLLFCGGCLLMLAV